MTLGSILDLMHLSTAGESVNIGKHTAASRGRNAAKVRVEQPAGAAWLVNLPEANSCTAWPPSSSPICE